MTDRHRVPGPLIVDENLASSWTTFIQEFSIYLIATEKSKKEDAVKTSLLLNAAGRSAIEIYNSFEYSEEEDKEDYNVVVKKFEEYCRGKINLPYLRYMFNSRNQHEGENIELYIRELRKLAINCEYDKLKDSLIRDRIVCGVRDNDLRKKMLQQTSLDLTLAIEMAKAHESSMKQSEMLGGNYNFKEVESIRSKNGFSQSSKGNFNEWNTCRFCKKTHNQSFPHNCPAYGQKCHKCHGFNHFAVACRSKREDFNKKMPSPYIRELKKTTKLNASNEQSDSEEYFVELVEHAVGSIEGKSQELLKVKINEHNVWVKPDTGADISVMSFSVFTQLSNKDLKRTNCTLRGWLGPKITPLGSIELLVSWNGHDVRVVFMVIDHKFHTILGKTDSISLGIVKYNQKNINSITQSSDVENLIKSYPNVFDGKLGCIGNKVKLHVNPEVQPKVNPLRRIPAALHQPAYNKIQKMLKDGVIVPEVEPTDWVNSLLIVEKKGKDSKQKINEKNLRICIDPRSLNEAIKRPHFSSNTLEEITSRLTGARYFSILDAQNGFWQIELDEASSKLTTFITPWGRYRFLRLPFGINASPEIFQNVITRIFQGLTGVELLADDICIWGRTEKEHDDRLAKVLQAAKNNNLKLNPTKIQLKKESVKYLGHIFSRDGVTIDQDRVKALFEIPEPTDKKAVQRMLGCVNYMGRFIKNRAALEEPLRKIICNDVSFTWGDEQREAWINIISLLSKPPTLAYFDPEKELVLTTDASSKGLGGELRQGDNVLGYVSSSLNETQQNYAQIEKELLAIVFAVKKFHHYLYGRRFKVFTDHQPLISIFKKSLFKTPQRLQKMLLKLQTYNIEILYKKGKLMFMADTLSRGFSKNNQDSEVEEDFRVNNIETSYIFSIKEESIYKTATLDTVYQIVYNLVKSGWPRDKSLVSSEAHNLWKFRDELVIQDGLIYKGNRLLVPKALRKEMLNSVHSAHMGYINTLNLAKEHIYWPGISTDIKNLIEKCDICQKFGHSLRKEPMIPHPVPTLPWQDVGMDIFQMNSAYYLLMIDYFSKYAEISMFHQGMSAEETIMLCKEQFARHGVPQKIFTDNGPQFSSWKFKEFSKKWHFKHITSSPIYPQSNGLAERTIQTYKQLIRKAISLEQDPYMAILNWRNTPIVDSKSSAQLLFNRRTRTQLPTRDEALEPENQNLQSTRQALLNRQQKMTRQYNQGARLRTAFTKGDIVWYRKNQGEVWKKGTVFSNATSSDGQQLPRSHILKNSSGTEYRRNQRFIKVRPKTKDEYKGEVSRNDDNKVAQSADSETEDEDMNDLRETQQERKETLNTQENKDANVNIQKHSEDRVIMRSRCGRMIKKPDRFIQHTWVRS